MPFPYKVCVYKQRAFNASIKLVKIVANTRKIGKMIHNPCKRHTTEQEDYDFTKKLLRIWSNGHFFDIFLSICSTDLTSEFFIGKTLRSILTAPCWKWLGHKCCGHLRSLKTLKKPAVLQTTNKFLGFCCESSKAQLKI